MAPFTISDDDLSSLKDFVVVLTGASSGIGLATTKLLLDRGAKVVAGDRQAPPDISNPNFTFLKADVTSWTDLAALFRAAQTKHGRIDHAFANAGISGRANYVEDELDDDGELKEPNNSVIHINLIGVINTTKLAIHYIKKHEDGGSVVLTASTAAYQRFSVVDYTTAKHGVLGLMRGLAGHLHPKIPIRINAIAPSWTATGIVPADVLGNLGILVQPPEAVARSVAVLMADAARNQQLIYSVGGVYTEIEGDLLHAADVIRPKEVSEEDDFVALMKAGGRPGAAR